MSFVNNIGVALGKCQRGKPKDTSHVSLLGATLEKELERLFQLLSLLGAILEKELEE